MKNIVILFIALAGSFSVLAQSADKKDVAAAVESLRQAMVDARKDVLENLAAPELSYGHSSGVIEDKAAFIENIVNGKSDFTAITLSEQSIRIVDKTALVRHKMLGETNNDGKPGTLNLSVLTVWQKQKGQWKLLARQSTRLQP